MREKNLAKSNSESPEIRFGLRIETIIVRQTNYTGSCQTSWLNRGTSSNAKKSYPIKFEHTDRVLKIMTEHFSFRSCLIKIVILLHSNDHQNDYFLIKKKILCSKPFDFHNTYKSIWKFSKNSLKNSSLNSLVNIFDELWIASHHKAKNYAESEAK